MRSAQVTCLPEERPALITREQQLLTKEQQLRTKEEQLRTKEMFLMQRWDTPGRLLILFMVEPHPRAVLPPHILPPCRSAGGPALP